MKTGETEKFLIAHMRILVAVEREWLNSGVRMEGKEGIYSFLGERPRNRPAKQCCFGEVSVWARIKPGEASYM